MANIEDKKATIYTDRRQYELEDSVLHVMQRIHKSKSQGIEHIAVTRRMYEFDTEHTIVRIFINHIEAIE